MYIAYLKKMPEDSIKTLFVLVDDINSEHSLIRVAPYPDPFNRCAFQCEQLYSKMLYTIYLTKDEVLADLAECPTVLGDDLEDILKSIQVLGLS